MELEFKVITGLLAAGFAIAAPIPYIYTIFKGRTRPHIFSWVIWTLLNVIAFLAQVTGGAGPGAWVTAASAISSTFISILSYKFYKTISINKIDKVSFLFALSAIPVWIITDNPLYAAIIVTTIGLVAYVPTVRKAWNDPSSENSLSYILHFSKCVFGLAAISIYNFTTVLYPAAFLMGNIMMIAVLLIRYPNKK